MRAGNVGRFPWQAARQTNNVKVLSGAVHAALPVFDCFSEDGGAPGVPAGSTRSDTLRDGKETIRFRFLFFFFFKLSKGSKRIFCTSLVNKKLYIKKKKIKNRFYCFTKFDDRRFIELSFNSFFFLNVDGLPFIFCSLYDFQ